VREPRTIGGEKAAPCAPLCSDQDAGLSRRKRALRWCPSQHQGGTGADLPLQAARAAPGPRRATTTTGTHTLALSLPSLASPSLPRYSSLRSRLPTTMRARRSSSTSRTWTSRGERPSGAGGRGDDGPACPPRATGADEPGPCILNSGVARASTRAGVRCKLQGLRAPVCVRAHARVARESEPRGRRERGKRECGQRVRAGSTPRETSPPITSSR